MQRWAIISKGCSTIYNWNCTAKTKFGGWFVFPLWTSTTAFITQTKKVNGLFTGRKNKDNDEKNFVFASMRHTQFFYF